MPAASHCQRHDLGLLRVTGRDARRFLHAQVTQAINDLPPKDTRLAAWLSAKGRVQALFDVVPSGEGFWLITDSDNADWLAAALSRYVLRADVRVEVATDRIVYGAYGDIAPALAALGVEFESGRVVERDGVVWIHSEPSSVLVIAPQDSPAVTLPGNAAADGEDAISASLAAGRPALPSILRERHTAHMLNLDRLGAISFTKGCYPGQEIVARTQNLGTVKRRLRRFAVGSGPRPVAGDAVIDAANQSVGEINRVAATDQGFQLLAVVPVDSEAGGLRLESDGRALTALPLPTDS